MSLTSKQVTVTTTQQEVTGHNVMPTKVTFVNHENGSGKKIYIGGGNVTPENGMLLGDIPIVLDLYPMSHIHAVTDSGTAVLGIIIQKQGL